MYLTSSLRRPHWHFTKIYSITLENELQGVLRIAKFIAILIEHRLGLRQTDGQIQGHNIYQIIKVIKVMALAVDPSRAYCIMC